ncbi:MAG: TetR/AcrR family transcriptional regulator [Steroidobacteraceae bacterium]
MTTIKTKRRKLLSQSRKSAHKREAIIRAAIEVVNTKSYALATMADIAAALDLRDATLYHYFPDKRALAYACHRRSLERVERLLHATDHAGGTGAERLRHFIHSMLVDSAKHGPLFYLGDYSYLDGPQRNAVEAWVERLTNVLVKFLRRGMSDGSVVQCEPELVVQLLLGMLIWLGKWAPTIDGLTVERLMSAIDAFSFRGIDRGLPSFTKSST